MKYYCSCVFNIVLHVHIKFSIISLLDLAGIILTGRNGLIPVNSFLTDNSSILTPFEGTVGNYIRCGSIGGSPDWYRENGINAFYQNTSFNNHYIQSLDTADFWHATFRVSRNQEVECRTIREQDTLSGFLGIFIREGLGKLLFLLYKL